MSDPGAQTTVLVELLARSETGERNGDAARGAKRGRS